MTRRRPSSRRGWFAAATLAVALLVDPASGQISPGSKPDFDWLVPPVNALGSASLADLQGKLVWVEFWGTY